MAKVLVYRGRNREAVFDLRPGAVVGRARACALQLDDRLVSRRHARFRQVGSGWEIEDLGSPNGLWVGEERVARADLRPGDAIAIGQHVLVFQEGDLTEAEMLLEMARRQKPTGPGCESTERLPQVRIEHLLEQARLRIRAHLVLLAGDERRGIPLDGERLLVGHSPGCDVALPGRGPLLGRRAAELIRDARGTWFLRPLSRAAGVRLNGERVLLGELADGDSIQVRGCTLRFHTDILGA